jgi:hypothetical protein
MSEEIEDGLTIELIEEHELHYMTRNVGGWTYMDTSSSYDEGYQYHEIVWKEDATGRFFAFEHRTNSWDTEGLYEQELNIRQVYPKEIVVTRYFDKP